MLWTQVLILLNIKYINVLIPYQGILSKYNIRPIGVLHIGANVGQEVSDYYNNGVERTVWIEADPSLISPLIANLQPYNNHLVFNSCLTDTDGEEITLNIANNGGQSSSILQLGTHKTVHPEVHYVDTHTLHSQRLDTLFNRYEMNIEEYPFVNIDIQGAELLCLKGFGELLHKVKYLYLEINDASLYKNCALYPEVKDYLSKYGFVVKDKVMCGNTNWGDCFLINENL